MLHKSADYKHDPTIPLTKATSVGKHYFHPQHVFDFDTTYGAMDVRIVQILK